MADRILSGTLLDEQAELSLEDIGRLCSRSTEWVIELVEQGVLEPTGDSWQGWRFSGTSLVRARVARRLQRDLDINVEGVALAIELMDEIRLLRERLSRIEGGPD
ncbi:MAG: chaperone modulator CbpM [Woeseiaceae bacterium]|jgi:chaperone modulatory protein CbpM